MDVLLKEFEDMGFEVEVGWKEKNRKKTILAALRKLRESGDDVKFNYVKTLYRYYYTINSLGYILYPKIFLLKRINMDYIIFVVI